MSFLKNPALQMQVGFFLGGVWMGLFPFVREMRALKLKKVLPNSFLYNKCGSSPMNICESSYKNNSIWDCAACLKHLDSALRKAPKWRQRLASGWIHGFATCAAFRMPARVIRPSATPWPSTMLASSTPASSITAKASRKAVPGGRRGAAAVGFPASI